MINQHLVATKMTVMVGVVESLFSIKHLSCKLGVTAIKTLSLETTQHLLNMKDLTQLNQLLKNVALQFRRGVQTFTCRMVLTRHQIVRSKDLWHRQAWLELRVKLWAKLLEAQVYQVLIRSAVGLMESLTHLKDLKRMIQLAVLTGVRSTYWVTHRIATS